MVLFNTSDIIMEIYTRVFINQQEDVRRTICIDEMVMFEKSILLRIYIQVSFSQDQVEECGKQSMQLLSSVTLSVLVLDCLYGPSFSPFPICTYFVIWLFSFAPLLLVWPYHLLQQQNISVISKGSASTCAVGPALFCPCHSPKMSFFHGSASPSA